MNLSFSTRGWTELNWEDTVAVASEMGFSGIEVYNLPKFDPMLDKSGPFHKYNVAGTIRQLKEKNIVIPCFDTSFDISGKDENLSFLQTLIETAHNARVQYVSVAALSDNETAVKENLSKLILDARQNEVTILIKTSGIYADTARLRKLLDEFASDFLAVLWDVHHPFRDFGEPADTTIKNLGDYVRHVHLRDSDDDGEYNLIGEGTAPIKDFMLALSSVNYNGFISLEWKPEWIEDLKDIEIIFPYFKTHFILVL